MNPEDYQKVKEIFNSVLGIEAERRAALLDQKCAGDQPLRNEVERLLVSYDSEYLENPAVGSVAESIASDGFAAGDSVGHYTFLRKIGSGGMGEVYLAEDGKLGRRVAIKLLPETFTEDADRLRRFEQEARTASALNHPNILTVFEIGETGNTRYIATEYIDGETLRAKLNRGSLPISEALDIAAQCASALAAAHENGIIHRDIKPENIMLRRDNLVKVLDFGLAKLIEKKDVSVSQDALTERHLKTAPGVIMGTVQYMSPEQTRGYATDARSDIWSLGVVMYEMVAGQPPFAGENAADLIAEIVKSSPASLSAVIDDVPERLDEIVAKTLVKNPDERYQTAHDLADDIKRLRRKLDFEGESEASYGSPSKPNATARSSNDGLAAVTAETGNNNTQSSVEYVISGIRKNKLISAAAGTMLLVLVVAAGYQISRSPEPVLEQSVPFESIEVSRLTRTGRATRPALSQDGKFVAYTNTEGDLKSIVVRQIATGSEIVVVPPAEVDAVWACQFSSDGNFLYYISYENLVGTLYRIGSVGGMAKRLVVDVDYSPAFAPDGSRFAFVRFDPVAAKAHLMIANSDGSDQQILMETESIGDVSEIAWSPTGDRLFMAGIQKSDAQGDSVVKFYTASVTEKKIEPLGDRQWYYTSSCHWLSDGSGIVFTGGDLPASSSQVWLLTYPAGEARRITNDAIRYDRMSGLARGNMFAVPRRESISSIWTLDLDSGTAIQRTAENPNLLGVMGMAALPDGRLLLTKVDSPRIDLWITDVDGKNETRLSNDDAVDTSPTVTSDGRLIVFASKRNGSKRIWRMDIDGQNRRQLSDESEEVDDTPKILTDNKTVVFTRAKAGYRSRIMRTSIDGGPTEPLLTAPTDILDYPGVSRDGKYLSYWSQVWDAKKHVYNSTQKVLRIEGEKFLPTDVSFKAERRPFAASEWTDDNRLLFQTTADLSNIYVVSLNGGAPKKLTNFSSGTVQWYALSADGKTVFIVRGIDTHDIFLISDASGS